MFASIITFLAFVVAAYSIYCAIVSIIGGASVFKQTVSAVIVVAGAFFCPALVVLYGIFLVVCYILMRKFLASVEEIMGQEFKVA